MRKLFIVLLSAALFSSCAVTRDSNDFVFPTKVGKHLYERAYDNAMRAWRVKYSEEDIPTDYGWAHVIITGPKSAPPIVLFHGTDASSTMWFPNVGALAKEHRVYAIDYPMETGKSLAFVREMGPQEMIKFYNQVFDHYKLTDITVVGASRGGWVATLLALQPDNKIGRLALLSPAQTFGSLDKLFKAMSALKLKMFPSPKQLDRFFGQFSYFPEKIDRRYKEQFYLANKFGRSKPDLMKMKRFSKEELASLKIPVLVLVGDNDVINDTGILDRATESIPHVKTAVVWNAGHFLSVDQPSVVNKMILDFLAQPDVENPISAVP